MASCSTSWQIEVVGRVRLGWAQHPPADAGCLHPRERAWLDRLDLRPGRQSEWIAGRLGLALLLPPGAHVLAAADGSPAVAGTRGWAASISHEDGWVAVAARPGGGRIAIDVVPDRAARLASRALARARVSGDTGEPTAAWAALESVAKLHGLGVAVLLDERGVGLTREDDDHYRVRGLGPPSAVWLHRLPGAVLAVADEPWR